MNRAELVKAISEKSDVAEKDVDKALKGFHEVVADVVSKGKEKITIPGFLSFERGHRAARQGRNPQTGETIQIAATNTVKVSAGSQLKAAAAGKK
jgi:DNA-binding protein HU-beta